MKISLKNILLFPFIFLFFSTSFAQVNNNPVHINSSNFSVSPVANPQQAITNILFGGCVNLSNITFSGAPLQIGYFVDHSGTFGIDSGLVLTTGSIDSIGMPNINASTSFWHSNSIGDSLLSQISGNPTFDAATIEFDFTPQSDTLVGCEFIFASEEYPEFVGSTFNDVYGFFISGNGISVPQNLAFIPGTSIPITVNNINATTNAQFFVDNTNGSVISFDGYTAPFKLNYQVTPNGTYHFKISIADASDQVYDAAVFIKGGSFFGNEPLPYSNFTYTNMGGNTVNFLNLSFGAEFYNWDFGDTQNSPIINPTHTYSSSGTYNVRLSADNYCYSQDTIIQVNVTQNVGINEHPVFLDYSSSWVNSDELMIKAQLKFPAKATLDIFDLEGKKVFSVSGNDSVNQEFYLDFSTLPQGIYFVKLIASNSEFAFDVFHF